MSVDLVVLTRVFHEGQTSRLIYLLDNCIRGRQRLPGRNAARASGRFCAIWLAVLALLAFSHTGWAAPVNLGGSFVLNISGAGEMATTNQAAATPVGVPALILTAVGANGQVNLSWTAVAIADSYTLYRGTAPNGEGSAPYKTGLTGTTYSDTGVSNGTTYYYQITAYKAPSGTLPSGESARSNEAFATPLAGTLPGPTGLTATPGVDGLGHAQVGLNFNPVAGAASYNVYVGTDPTHLVLKQTGLLTTSYTDLDVNLCVTYYYEVAAVNQSGEGARSQEISVTPHPPKPANPTIAPNGGRFVGSVSVTLADATAGALIYYTLDGSTPTAASTLYTTPFTLSNTTVVKAIAVFGGCSASDIVSATFPKDQPPTVSLTAPAEGALVAAPGTITVSANASDDVGVSKVDFYQGSTLIGTATASPYNITWANVPASDYTLTAQATDTAGQTAASLPVHIRVDAPPTVSLTAPANGAIFGSPATFSVSATAADSDGTISKVDFYQGSTLLGTATSSPYTVPWANVTAGAYSLTAKATDDRGLIATSSAIQISVVAVLSSLAVSPASVQGGQGSVGTVTLSDVAPSGGAAIALSSDKTSATVPANVLIPAGQTSATFPISTAPVSSAVAATISASYQGVIKTAPLAINPATLLNVSVAPPSVVGGSPATGTVTLSGSAPTGGTVVGLASNQAAAALPSSVTVPGGQASATFVVSTVAVGADTAATLSASLNGTTKTTTLTVTAPTLVRVGVIPATVAGGGSSSATVTLSSAAPAGGLAISLASDKAAATVPASVTVLAGQTTAAFTVTTSPVSASTTATLTGTLNGISQSATLTVTPPDLLSLSLSPASVTGGSSSTGTVTLTSIAPSGGLNVILSSDNAAATLPASVLVPAGQTTATFAVSTVAVGTVTTANIAGTLGSTTKSAPLTINPPGLLSLSVSPTSVVGGNPATGMVTLSSPAPSGGLSVTLSSSDPAAGVPATVPVPAGQSTATFPVSTTAVAASVNVTLSATLNSITRTAALTVTPAPCTVSTLSSLTVTPTSVAHGASATATVTLSGPALVGGQVVTLSSDNAAAQVPDTILIPAGQGQVSFAVSTTAVASQTSVTLAAAYHGVVQTVVLTLTP